MIKKLLPTMIGAALVGGMTTAAADVTVFGHLDTSINNVDTEIAGVSADDTNFHCTTCSVGFKGSEDLGNGLKAIFKLDFQFDTINRNRASDGLTRSPTVTSGWVWPVASARCASVPSPPCTSHTVR